MTAVFDRILRRYGQTVTVRDKAEKAFFQPVMERGKTTPFQVTSLGTVDDRSWLYFGCSEVQPGDAVTVQGRSYTVRNSAAVRLGDEVFYWWAALTPESEAAE